MHTSGRGKPDSGARAHSRVTSGREVAAVTAEAEVDVEDAVVQGVRAFAADAAASSA
jgi:hypothetical protein